jgi:hypothetical protein
MKKKFIRHIVFSKSPLECCLMHPDFFQLYPCEFENAPKSRLTDIPLVLEFWIDEDEKLDLSEFQEYDNLADMVGYWGQVDIAKTKILSLLSAISNQRFFHYNNTDIKWGLPFPDKEMEEMSEEEKDKYNNAVSRPFMMAYMYPNVAADTHTTEFTKVKYPKPELVDFMPYFMDDPLEDKNKPASFSNLTHAALQGYLMLDPDSLKIANVTAHLICNGIDLRSKMKSMSFLSFISAIETMANFIYRNEKDNMQFECKSCQAVKSSSYHCTDCGRPIWGVKAKFKKFLSEHVSAAESSLTKYNKYYNLRSDIAHNGGLLIGDAQPNWGKSAKADSQWMMHLEVMQVARLSFTKWLVKEFLNRKDNNKENV